MNESIQQAIAITAIILASLTMMATGIMIITETIEIIKQRRISKQINNFIQSRRKLN